MKEIKIGSRLIGAGHPPFIIAEAGINHNGELDKALNMVCSAKKCGADAIKFQTFKAEEFVGDRDLIFTYRSEGKEKQESMFEMFKRYELSPDSWFQIKSECEKQNIVFMSTPQNISDLDFLMELNIPAIKVGSDDFTNLPLITSYASYGLPLILSCGMADIGEVYQALEAAGAFNHKPVALLLCTSQYPTPDEDVNLNKLKTLQAAFPDIIFGLSDHTQGVLASSLALALGASVFEKHFTLNHDLPGPDHWFSENIESLESWVSSIRKSSIMMGEGLIKPTEKELEMRKIARRSVVALTDLVKGEQLTLDNIGLRRPGTGLPPVYLDKILGFYAARDMCAGEVFELGDIAK